MGPPGDAWKLPVSRFSALRLGTSSGQVGSVVLAGVCPSEGAAAGSQSGRHQAEPGAWPRQLVVPVQGAGPVHLPCGLRQGHCTVSGVSRCPAAKSNWKVPGKQFTDHPGPEVTEDKRAGAKGPVCPAETPVPIAPHSAGRGCPQPGGQDRRTGVLGGGRRGCGTWLCLAQNLGCSQH